MAETTPNSGTPNPPVVPTSPAVPPPVPGITEAEVTHRVERARKEEKDKLYGEIEALKATTAQTAKEKEELTRKLTDLEGRLQVLTNASKKDGQIDADSIVKGVTEQVTKVVSKEIEDLKGAVAEERKARKKAELKLHAQQKIAESGGNIVAELVSGNSVEEIDASVEKAKKAYADIVAKVKGSATADSADSNNASGQGSVAGGGDLLNPNPPPGGGTPRGTPNQPGPLNNVRGLNRKEYADKREELLRSLSQRYPASNPMAARR